MVKVRIHERRCHELAGGFRVCAAGAVMPAPTSTNGPPRWQCRCRCGVRKGGVPDKQSSMVSANRGERTWSRGL